MKSEKYGIKVETALIWQPVIYGKTRQYTNVIKT